MNQFFHYQLFEADAIIMTSTKPLKGDVFVSIFFPSLSSAHFKTLCCLAGARFCNTGTFNIEYTEQKIRFAKRKKSFAPITTKINSLSILCSKYNLHKEASL